jgi:outer membrane protein OmpA-like peptidoglycan-associated protein
VTVHASGRAITLGGTPPTEAAQREALTIALDARCPTWLGSLPCVREVEDTYDAPQAGPLRAPMGVGVGAGAPAAVVGVPDANASAPTPERRAAAQACARAFATELERSRIQFRGGGAEISGNSETLLDRLASIAHTCPGKIRIEGHTDSLGNTHDNLRMSQARALAVAQDLVNRGVEIERLQAQGFGGSRPVASSDTEQGRDANRRIEIKPVEAD